MASFLDFSVSATSAQKCPKSTRIQEPPLFSLKTRKHIAPGVSYPLYSSFLVCPQKVPKSFPKCPTGTPFAADGGKGIQGGGKDDPKIGPKLDTNQWQNILEM